MADQKTTGLNTATTADDADLLMVVDVSDLSMAATGTNKKITTGNFVGSVASQVEAEAGTETAIKRFSPLRIFQAIASWVKDSGGWMVYGDTMPTVTTSDSNGVDTISFASVDITDSHSVGNWVKIVHSTAGTLYFKIKSLAYSTNTTMTIVGETSVPATGTITAISFSRSETPQGVQKWEEKFSAAAYGGGTQTGVGDSVDTKVTNLTEQYDNGDLYTSYKMTAKVTGKHEIRLMTNAHSTTQKLAVAYIKLYKNGSSLALELNAKVEYNAWYIINNKDMTIPLIRGDYIELYVNHDTIDGSSSYIVKSNLEMHFKSL